MSTDYRKEIINKVIKIIMFLRDVYIGLDNKIYESLNDDFMDEVIALLNLIPNDVIYLVYDSLMLSWDIACSIDVNKFCDAMDKHQKARFTWDLSTYVLFSNNVVRKNEKINDKVKATFYSIINRLIPIFDAADGILNRPNITMKRIRQILGKNNENSEILKNIT